MSCSAEIFPTTFTIPDCAIAISVKGNRLAGTILLVVVQIFLISSNSHTDPMKDKTEYTKYPSGKLVSNSNRNRAQKKNIMDEMNFFIFSEDDRNIV